MDFEEVKKVEPNNEVVEDKKERAVIGSNPNADLEKDDYQKLVNETERNDQQQLSKVREKIAAISTESRQQEAQESRENYDEAIKELAKSVNGILNYATGSAFSKMDLIYTDAILEDEERRHIKKRSKITWTEQGEAEGKVMETIGKDKMKELGITEADVDRGIDRGYDEHLVYLDKLEALRNAVLESPEYAATIQKIQADLDRIAEEKIKKLEEGGVNSEEIRRIVETARKEKKEEIKNKILDKIQLVFNVVDNILRDCESGDKTAERKSMLARRMEIFADNITGDIEGARNHLESRIL